MAQYLLQQPLPQIFHGVSRIRCNCCRTALSKGVSHHAFDVICIGHRNAHGHDAAGCRLEAAHHC